MKKLNHLSMLIKTVTVLSIACIFAVGCSPLQPAKSVSVNTYAIEAQFEPVPSTAGEVTLLVNTPSAHAGFDSSRMVYIKKLHEIEYFSQNQWVDNPARMLTPLIVQALEYSSNYRAVVNVRSGAAADLRLDTEIIRLQHEFLVQPSQVHLTVRVQLIDIQGKHVLATREFDVKEAAPSDDPYGGVIATNRAVKIFLLQLSDFCAAQRNAVTPRSGNK